MIVVDTHALLWWACGVTEQLSQPAQSAIEIELAGGHIMVSSISAWEISMLVSRGRVALAMNTRDWLATLGQIEALHYVPVDNEIAILSTELPGEFHKDPADRLIVATARKLGCPLVTADEKIRAYPHVRTVW